MEYKQKTSFYYFVVFFFFASILAGPKRDFNYNSFIRVSKGAQLLCAHAEGLFNEFVIVANEWIKKQNKICHNLKLCVQTPYKKRSGFSGEMVSCRRRHAEIIGTAITIIGSLKKNEQTLRRNCKT